MTGEEGRGLTDAYQPKGKSGGITLEIIGSLSILLRRRIARGHRRAEIDERLAKSTEYQAHKRLEDMSGFWPNHLGEGWRDGPGQRPQQWHRPRRRSLQGFPISLRIGRDGRKRLGEEEEDRLRNPFFLLRQASSWSRSILVRRRRHFCRRPRRGTASSSGTYCWAG